MSYPVAGYGYGGGYSKSVAFVLVLFHPAGHHPEKRHLLLI